MRISELIGLLESFRGQYGDVEVLLRDGGSLRPPFVRRENWAKVNGVDDNRIFYTVDVGHQCSKGSPVCLIH